LPTVCSHDMVGVDLLVEHGGEDLSHADGSLREHRLTDQESGR
jgi:hypothetical protein